MKILTNRQLVEIENQTLNKIYAALEELHERDNSTQDGIVENRHDELLDLALKHLEKYHHSNIYPLIRCAVNFADRFIKSKH